MDLNPPNNNFQDPSINVSPKNSNRSTSFFAQPGTLAGKFQQKILHCNNATYSVGNLHFSKTCELGYPNRQTLFY